MRSKYKEIHPATLFFLLTVGVILISWMLYIYGVRVVQPHTGEMLLVQNMLSPEGVRWTLRNVVSNFTSFAPLGMVLVAMLGIGVAQDSGLVDASIRFTLKNKSSQNRSILFLIFLGILSNVIGDAGYILLIPLSAVWFSYIGLHPVVGIITSFVSVAGGYSANVFISTLDPLIARVTQEAAVKSGVAHELVGPFCNYFFMFASTFLLIAVIFLLVKKWLIPLVHRKYALVEPLIYRALSRRERRSLLFSLFTAVLYAVLILVITFSPWGFLRGVSGGLIRAPFVMGALFLLSLGLGIMGVVYGFTSGRYRSDIDVIKGLSSSMRVLANFIVIAFFASQFFGALTYTHLDEYLVIKGAELLTSIQGPSYFILVIGVVGVASLNLVMVSSLAKWNLIAVLILPYFELNGWGPEVAQAVYRIGDSATNAITPFLFYMPLAFTYLQEYEGRSSFSRLLSYTWKFSCYILLLWTLFLVFWLQLGLPLGM